MSYYFVTQALRKIEKKMYAEETGYLLNYVTLNVKDAELRK